MLKLDAPPRLALAFLLATFALPAGACSSGTGAPPLAPGGYSAACSDTHPCRSPLVCRNGSCDIDPTQGEGEACTLSAQCLGALYCAEDRRCRAAGTGGAGSACTFTADCMASLVCVPGGAGMVCTDSGTVDVGGGCIGDAQCLAGLTCVGIQCSDGTSGLDSGTGSDGSTGMDAGLDVGRDSGRGDGATEDTGTPPDSGMFDTNIPDAGFGCDPTSCDDDDPCTVEMCAGTACVNRLVDFDHDGYASNMFDRSCGDCSDSEADAHPGQTRWFGTAHRAGADDPAGFDWNCDGTEQQQYTATIASCRRPSGSLTCPSSEGWQGSVPACGDRGAWTRCNDDCTIGVVESNRLQGCH